jgi:hypothetical protein
MASEPDSLRPESQSNAKNPKISDKSQVAPPTNDYKRWFRTQQNNNPKLIT